MTPHSCLPAIQIKEASLTICNIDYCHRPYKRKIPRSILAKNVKIFRVVKCSDYRRFWIRNLFTSFCCYRVIFYFAGVRLLVGDVVWGKILGFPWWPGKILTMTSCGGQGPQAHVAWYGSSTSSLMQCDQLSHYLDNFKVGIMIILTMLHASLFIQVRDENEAIYKKVFFPAV